MATAASSLLLLLQMGHPCHLPLLPQQGPQVGCALATSMATVCFMCVLEVAVLPAAVIQSSLCEDWTAVSRLLSLNWSSMLYTIGARVNQVNLLQVEASWQDLEPWVGRKGLMTKTVLAQARLQ
jgi:hypothetical protein